MKSDTISQEKQASPGPRPAVAITVPQPRPTAMSRRRATGRAESSHQAVHALEEIGQQFGIIKERVRQFNARALKDTPQHRRRCGQIICSGPTDYEVLSACLFLAAVFGQVLTQTQFPHGIVGTHVTDDAEDGPLWRPRVVITA